MQAHTWPCAWRPRRSPSPRSALGATYTEFVVLAALLFIAGIPVFNTLIPRMNALDSRTSMHLVLRGHLGDAPEVTYLDPSGDLRLISDSFTFSPDSRIYGELHNAALVTQADSNSTDDYCYILAQINTLPGDAEILFLDWSHSNDTSAMHASELSSGTGIICDALDPSTVATLLGPPSTVETHYVVVAISMTRPNLFWKMPAGTILSH